jgi:hypothetical protein
MKLASKVFIPRGILDFIVAYKQNGEWKIFTHLTFFKTSRHFDLSSSNIPDLFIDQLKDLN